MLENKIIKNILINEEKTALKFECEDCTIMAVCESDCCSETWIEHVTLPSYMSKKMKVVSVENIDLGEVIATRQECDQLYGVKIKLDGFNNEIGIEFRNSSNGYYGGSLVFFDEKVIPPYLHFDLESWKECSYTKLETSF